MAPAPRTVPAGAGRSGDERAARARVLDAAVRCILEEGYYRASSNRIAAKAGLTWGVIQHHFGTRENLLLAVVRESAAQLRDSLAAAVITGATTEERIDALADVVWAQYRRPEFLAYMQTVLNLSCDPRTAGPTLEAIEAIEQPIGEVWQDLMRAAVPDADPGVAATVFDALRGAAIGENLMDAFPHSEQRQRRADRRLLVRALALLVDGVP